MAPGVDRSRPRWPLALLAFIALGTALRALLLPVGVHPDLLSVYHRVELVFSGSHDWADFSVQALPMACHGLWVWISGVPLPDMGGVVWPNPTEGQVWREASRVLSTTSANTLVLWKLPYMLCDLGVGLVLTRLVPPRRRVGIAALWAVNPMLLYTVGVFAKYEPFMLLPLCLGLLQFKRGRMRWGFVLLGVAIAMRGYVIFLLPAMVAAASLDTRRRLELAALALAPLSVTLAGAALAENMGWPLILSWLVALVATAGLFVAYNAGAVERPLAKVVVGTALVAGAIPTADVTFASDSSIWNLLHHVRFALGDLGANRMDGLWWFGFALAAIIIGSGLRSKQRDSNTPIGNDVVDAGLATALAFFGLAVFHPQYSTLLVVLMLARMHRLESGSVIFAMQVIGLAALTLHPSFLAGNTTVRLLLPLDPVLVAELPDPRTYFPAGLAAFPWPAVGRSMLVIAGGWAIFEMTRRPVPAPGVRLNWVPLVAALAAWPLAIAWYVRELDTRSAADGVESPIGSLKAEWLARVWVDQPSGIVALVALAFVLVSFLTLLVGMARVRTAS